MSAPVLAVAATPMRVAMIGTGYVGLVSGACFAALGHVVTCVDADAARIARLCAGECPLYEDGLAALLDTAIQAGRLRFVIDPAVAVRGADVAFIAVGTPPRADTGAADLSQVCAAADAIAGSMDGYLVIANKSTAPPGTARLVAERVRTLRPGAAFDVASNPEFLREGAAVRDFMAPERVLLGVTVPRARRVLAALYEPLTRRGAPLVMTSPETAELTKYAANAFLATKVAFINEIADLCECTGADVRDVAHALGLDSRIGSRFLRPGPGYGGSCFPKDTKALTEMGRALGAPSAILEAVIDANQRRRRRMAARIIARCGGDVRGVALAVLGLTFKAGTDDLRDSPALDIVRALAAAGAVIRVYDPGVTVLAAPLDGVTLAADVDAAVSGAAAAVILTEWPLFRALTPDRFRTLLARPLVIDLRNLYDPDTMVAAGVRYYGVGVATADGVPP